MSWTECKRITLKACLQMCSFTILLRQHIARDRVVPARVRSVVQVLQRNQSARSLVHRLFHGFEDITKKILDEELRESLFMQLKKY